MRYSEFTSMTRTALTTLILLCGVAAAQAQEVYIQRNNAQRLYSQQNNGLVESNYYGLDTYRTEYHPAIFQLRTNGLYDLALCPNIGIEIQTSFGMAWQLDYIGAWWNSPSRNRFYSNYAFQTEFRYYFMKPKGNVPLTGHHVGLYGQMITYDFEFGGTGYQSRDLDMTFGIGASYGYSIPLNRRWSLDFTIGLGYFQSRYDEYDPRYIYGEKRFVHKETHRLKFWGPTKLEATFVWNINSKNDK